MIRRRSSSSRSSALIAFSAAAELGVPLLHEGLHALTAVLARKGCQEKLLLEREPGRQWRLHRLSDCTLGEHERDRREARHALGDLHRLVDVLTGLDEDLDQADAERLLRVDR